MINPTEYIKNKIGNVIGSVLNRADQLQAELKSNDQHEDLHEEENEIEVEDDSNNMDLSAEKKRENLRKNLEIKEPDLEDFEASRQKSMNASQGVADHSGSPVHGAGRNMSGKSNSSMWQRNFNNHQGN